ncbi:hypothetical protein [Gorillibacterium sp. sgz5001074]|uniref:hypothetical protein n=1 Tax=Gorillibacterium sp. sgz5001074 TaxID=3446695 RepID=UPI003F670D81
MKKWIIGTAVVLLLVFAVYRWGMSYAADRIVDQIADEMLPPAEIEKLKNDPDVKKAIEENFTPEEVKQIYAGQPAGGKSPASTPAAGIASPGAKPSGTAAPAASAAKVMDKDEALSLLMKKFSLAEIKGLAQKAADGLTDAEKTELQNTINARLTPEELERLKVTALLELMKRDMQ